ncbi:AAA family ATPase [Azomonas macrocytogenes]|uniref:DamX protein n=1 Tax=Azomonas macrocytogenes TaxID=69962 RepID=A0A839T2N0_AZOMA|nr:AAA family ATPase [Azomonas macrocytogenes]MBB3102910.1 DamX protein [Azomonas macrocytogenes]
MTSLSAQEPYLGQYGFTHDPFAARVPGFKFYPAQRKPILGQLHHLARYSQLLLLVVGPRGSGKTLLRQALVASSNKQAVQSIVITPDGREAAVLKQVALALGCDGHAVGDVMAQIGQATLNGQEIYLLVDDADRLGREDIDSLLHLAIGGVEGRAHVFLFGEPSLVSRVNAQVDDKESFHVIELQRYSKEETRGYLALRLEGAGSDLDCLSDEQIERIHELSGGWPGEINRVAREILLDSPKEGPDAGRFSIDGWQLPLPLKHLLGIAVIMVGVVLALLFQGKSEKLPSPDGEQLVANTGVADSSREETGRSEENGGMPPVDAGEQPLIREPLAAAASSEDGDMPELSSDSLVGGVPGLPRVAEAPPVRAKVQQAQPATPIEAVPPRERATPPVASRTPPTPPVVQSSPKVPISESRPAVRPQAPAQPQTPAKNAPVTSRATGVAGWYLSQPGSNYLLQVLGTRSEQTAQSILRQHGSNYHYYVKQHEGKPLYVVTYGNFGNRQAAMAAIKTLPASLQSSKPWIRNFASIQAEAR